MSAVERPARRAATSPTVPTRLAFRSAAAVGFFLAVAVAGLAADLLSKHYVFESLLSDPSLQTRTEDIRSRWPSLESDDVLKELHVRRRACPGVRFTLATNSGVVFGLPMPRWAVAGATLLAVGLVACFFATSEARIIAPWRRNKWFRE